LIWIKETSLLRNYTNPQKGISMFSESEGRGGGSRLGNLFGRFKGAISRWNEVHRLDALEMEAIARELNLSTAEFGALRFAPSGRLESLSRRLSHAGLSEAALAASHGDVLRDLRRVCTQCPAESRCARDLARERRATPSKYCPNEQTLRALERGARQRPSAQVFAFPAVRA
jgi:hypothetical protein